MSDRGEGKVTERLLVSTYNKVILWDGKARTIWDEHASPKFHDFFGITWNDEEIYVAEGGHNVESSLYHVFDGELKHTGVLPIGQEGKGIVDPHQIYWWGGKIYITSTKVDVVCIWDGAKLKRISWKKASEPTLHLNSIWCDGERFYVVEHRKRKMPKRVKILDSQMGPVGRIVLRAEGFIKHKPHGIHNVYIEDGILYTCSPRALVRHDLSSGRSEPVVPSPLMSEAHYVRGLARIPGKWFIGLSEVRARGERGKGDSAILVLNDDLEQIDLYPLQDTGGLTDIRAIDGPDLAHNGKECPYR